MKSYFSTLIISIILLSGCNFQHKGSAYIPGPEDSIPNDKNSIGLKGKVKTMDVYYFRPQSESSFFTQSFKKGEKWDYKGKHHIATTFTENGQLLQETVYDINNNFIDGFRYVYKDGEVSIRIDSFAVVEQDALQTIVYKFGKNGKHLETIRKYANGIEEEREINTYDEDGRLLKNLDRRTGLGEINDYDKNGNLVRKELLTDIDSHGSALTEYDYNHKNLLTEKRQYYNKVKLQTKYTYAYNENDLLTDEKMYNYGFDKAILCSHYTYEYNKENRLSAKYEVNEDNNLELVADYEYRYSPTGTLRFVLRNKAVLEEYDEEGQLKISREVIPGYHIIEDSEKHKYNYDRFGNWTEIKKFEDYAELGLGRPSGLVQITGPYIERRFTYYEQ